MTMNKPYPIAKAAEQDVPGIITLLQQCSLPTEDISNTRQSFWTVKSEQKLCGSVALENYGHCGLLRSFAVYPSFRNQGVGTALLNHAMEQAANMGFECLYLCTDSAALYFERHKWIYVPRDSVDEKVRQSHEFQSPWSDSTACMFFPVRQGFVKTAVQNFQSGFNCSQSVFSAFAPFLGLEVQEALKIATGFGAGIGYRGEVCGAVSGAYMAIGLKHGRWKAEDIIAKENTLSLMKELDTRFIARNGSLYCNKLLEGDISTSEGRKKIDDEHKFKTLCPRFVKDATEIAEKLLGQENPRLQEEKTLK